MKNILLIITLFISWNAIAEIKIWRNSQCI